MHTRKFFNPAIAALAAVAVRTGATMAAPTDKPIKLSCLPENELEQLRVQVNNLTVALRGIAAKLDLDATVTDVNYFSLWMDSAISTAPVKLTVL
ncbi:MAG: hypothetical protein M3P26_12870 [Gemmatimonadota bacterium]|nr:hypothetical protein [Gemmatimonadota bacterium]